MMESGGSRLRKELAKVSGENGDEDGAVFDGSGMAGSGAVSVMAKRLWGGEVVPAAVGIVAPLCGRNNWPGAYYAPLLESLEQHGLRRIDKEWRCEPRLATDGVGRSNWRRGWIWGGGPSRVRLGMGDGEAWDVGWKNRRKVEPGMMMAGGGEGSGGPPGPID